MGGFKNSVVPRHFPCRTDCATKLLQHFLTLESWKEDTHSMKQLQPSIFTDSKIVETKSVLFRTDRGKKRETQSSENLTNSVFRQPNKLAFSPLTPYQPYFTVYHVLSRASHAKLFEESLRTTFRLVRILRKLRKEGTSRSRLSTMLCM